jgi:haloacetate dehalogenase
MFDGFTLEHVEVDDGVSLRVRHGGADGPPLLLLHGHPRTHVTWHRVAPLLAPHFRLVCPDLRGYGGSSKPPTTPDHAPYSKRAMAADMRALMAALGHERFTVAGHDRGALVAFRLAMDHPEATKRLVIMDGLPVVEHLDRCDSRFAAAWWHWWFLGQTDKPAERVICADPDAWYTAGPEQMGEDGRTT